MNLFEHLLEVWRWIIERVGGQEDKKEAVENLLPIDALVAQPIQELSKLQALDDLLGKEVVGYPKAARQGTSHEIIVPRLATGSKLHAVTVIESPTEDVSTGMNTELLFRDLGDKRQGRVLVAIFIDPVDPNLRLLGHLYAFPMPFCQARMLTDPCDAAGSMISFADYVPEALDASAYLARKLD